MGLKVKASMSGGEGGSNHLARGSRKGSPPLAVTISVSKPTNDGLSEMTPEHAHACSDVRAFRVSGRIMKDNYC